MSLLDFFRPKISPQLLWLATNGDSEAQTRVGTLYLEGGSVPKDYKKAFFWFQKAAEQGSFVAQVQLGCMYFGGQGVPIDSVEAYKWIAVAAFQQKDIGRWMTSKEALESHMTPEEISEGQRRAVDF